MQDDDIGGKAEHPGDIMIDAIAEAVVKRIERIVATSQRLMDIDEAARYLGMTPHALRHKSGVEIPCVRIDAKLRFDRRDLDRWIDRAKRDGV
jgi:chromatin segregation and condensation protein Rec8/ScpA/Scc1 (kleisin family)